MTNESLLPQLPHGELSALSTLSQSFSFHSSPESFICSRVRGSTGEPTSSTESDPDPPIIRAKILNRNVAVISSRKICQAILETGHNSNQSIITPLNPEEEITNSTFAVQPAYHELMSDFFPAPNLLLQDNPPHASERQKWEAHISSLHTDTAARIRSLTESHLAQNWKTGRKFDLYTSLKDLSWSLLLETFLAVQAPDPMYKKVESLQETLLRGQFSLFPVSVNMPFWRSPRSKGLAARGELQELLSKHISAQDSGCPFKRRAEVTNDELASNVLLFTSSIAVKALASLLTATILNLFCMPTEDGTTLAQRIKAMGVEHIGTGNAEELLDSVLRETERLSPPVIGVMRRVMQDVVVASSSPEKRPTLIPKGWDVWLYFVSAARDKASFIEPGRFLSERFLGKEGEDVMGLAFGGGAKSCLGKEVVRSIVKIVATTLITSGIDLDGEVKAKGVRGWLGWDVETGIEDIARDLKQLPCQRPKDSIHLWVKRSRLS